MDRWNLGSGLGFMSRRAGTFFGDPGMRGNGPPNIDGMVTLKVDNVPYSTSVDELRRTFEKYGELGDVYMPRDLRTGEPRGFAFVRYMSQRDADDAIDRLDGEFFAGRELRIQYAKRRRPDFGGSGRGENGGRYGGRDTRRDDGYRRRSRSRSRSRSPRRRSRSRSRSRGRRGHRSRTRSPSPRRERRRRASSLENRGDRKGNDDDNRRRRDSSVEDRGDKKGNNDDNRRRRDSSLEDRGDKKDDNRRRRDTSVEGRGDRKGNGGGGSSRRDRDDDDRHSGRHRDDSYENGADNHRSDSDARDM